MIGVEINKMKAQFGRKIFIYFLFFEEAFGKLLLTLNYTP